ncbi:hypothetical protein [Caproicibacter sp.]|uniref:hypothetical protein n=1 Tax=Caproicibacter sp. TaxID=2814884 RepID=UPI003988A60C
MLKQLYLHVKKEFSWKAYWLLSLILFLITLVRPVYPVKEPYSPYQYQYGVIGSWVTFYQPANYGMKTLWYLISTPVWRKQAALTGQHIKTIGKYV